MQARGDDDHLLPTGRPARPSSGFDMVDPNRPKPVDGDVTSGGKPLEDEFPNTTGAVRVDRTRRKAPKGNPFGLEYDDEVPHYAQGGLDHNAQDRTLNWV